LDDIIDAADETLIAPASFARVAKFVKIAAFNAKCDVERGLFR